MKVGILSIYDNNNIGNRLQNYALQNILLKYADEVVTVKNKAKPSGRKYSFIQKFDESIALCRIIGKKRRIKFLKFNKKYLKNSKNIFYFDAKNRAPVEKCDYYCAGSDQVWNPNMKRVGMFNYLGFSPKEKNFSFAASFGVDKIPDEYKNYVKQGLNNIQYISVREDAGNRITEDLTGRKDAEVLIDPTLCFDADEWSKISKRPNIETDNGYVLCYFLGGVSKARESEINRVAQSKGLKIIDILDKENGYYDAVGPSEFVYLIKNADLICTDSFHASVFSFIFGNPLAIFPREGKNINMNSRLETLSSKFSLEKCLVKNESIDDTIFNADYSEGRKRLKDEQKNVDNFLNKVFSKEN